MAHRGCFGESGKRRRRSRCRAYALAYRLFQGGYPFDEGGNVRVQIGSGEAQQRHLEGHTRVGSLAHLQQRCANGFHGPGERGKPEGFAVVDRGGTLGFG